MYNNNSSPTLTNFSFSGNLANLNGGGMYNYESSPAMTNLVLSGNSAGTYGGGMLNSNSSSLTFANISSSGNSADDGGRLFNVNNSPAMINGSFSGNSYDINGGGIYNINSSPTLTNVSFSGNSSVANGGGMHKNNSPALTNVSFSGNSAELEGGGLFNYYSNTEVRNSILWNNQDSSRTRSITSTIANNNSAITLTYSLAQASKPGGIWIGDSYVVGGSNIDEDPMFSLSISPSIASTTTADLRLQYGSPAIDAGEDTYIAGFPTDLDGGVRIKDGNGEGSEIVYMGADEAPIRHLLTINKTGSGSGKISNYQNKKYCGGNCSAYLEESNNITLTATADPGSIFTVWEGDCSGLGNCLLNLDADKTVSANFASAKTILLPLLFR